jgi:hypothetical protein
MALRGIACCVPFVLCTCSVTTGAGDMVVVHERDRNGGVVSAGLVTNGHPIGCWLSLRPSDPDRVLSVYDKFGTRVAQMLVNDNELMVDVIVPSEDAVWHIHNSRRLDLLCFQKEGGRSSGLYLQFWQDGAVHLAGVMDGDLRVGWWSGGGGTTGRAGVCSWRAAIQAASVWELGGSMGTTESSRSIRGRR